MALYWANVLAIVPTLGQFSWFVGNHVTEISCKKLRYITLTLRVFKVYQLNYKVYQLITDSTPVFSADLKNHSYFAQTDQVTEIWD